MSRKKVVQDTKKLNEILGHKYQTYNVGDMIRSKKTNAIFMIVEKKSVYTVMELDTGQKRVLNKLQITIDYENLTEEVEPASS